jgi:hypothetical protein
MRNNRFHGRNSALASTRRKGKNMTKRTRNKTNKRTHGNKGTRVMNEKSKHTTRIKSGGIRGGGKDAPKPGENNVVLPKDDTHDYSLISSKKGHDEYSNNLYVRESHNCYTYFLNLKSQSAVDLCKDDFGKHNMCKRAQPGYMSGHEPMRDDEYNCPEVMKRTLSDNPNIYTIKSNEMECKPGYYKGAVVVAPGRDYHFYRQDDDNHGYWSHKPGYKPTTIKDSDNNIIKDPKTAARDYGGTLNYKDFCNYVCIPRNHKKKFMAHKGENVSDEVKQRFAQEASRQNNQIVALGKKVSNIIGGKRRTKKRHKKNF